MPPATPEGTPKGKGGGWTVEEKFKLLVAIIKATGMGSIPWNKVELPEGRTQKACTHVIQSIRAECGMSFGTKAKGKDDETQATGTKRKARSKSNAATAKKPANKKRKVVEDKGGEEGNDASDEEDNVDMPDLVADEESDAGIKEEDLEEDNANIDADIDAMVAGE
ncbi:MAG: hypothetical protein LQ340_006701 [Diploschistes diacapsis]|nr:MAG: hypothetical protein LQ340_006701 [Diploschistes diacapsis]